ncbi:multidrug ABC transporter ATPase [Microbacterium stercoris]|uniref:Multidrug ABC transporter ATPase n=1 Tax=Microbacterium stercoris TaxID=2820289 RepID=A0A939QNC4_9MICO|nr:multidrug ABC transporter ATPase [Microbacterium stercoris]MBO3663835.1 multidrug ABC transporter ATPase [Microbacterium stercoris]
MSTNSPVDPPVRRVDRILAFMALGIAIVSVLCFAAIITSTAMGMQHEDYGVGVWPVIGVFPLFGLPVAFLLILVLLIMTWTRKGKAGRS